MIDSPNFILSTLQVGHRGLYSFDTEKLTKFLLNIKQNSSSLVIFVYVN